ncbi:hypothetical protein DFH11DRAFT_1615243 [Phellopilus nigrolimitatus]|nr:hypothetical protein DFH11DRAFT_1615243 [Phellopilus nigrolimitatus]
MMVKFDDVLGLSAAIEQAKKSANEGGVPIGSSIVANVDGELKVMGTSHNQWIQKHSAIMHEETAMLEQADSRRRMRVGALRKDGANLPHVSKSNSLLSPVMCALAPTPEKCLTPSTSRIHQDARLLVPRALGDVRQSPTILNFGKSGTKI